MADWTSGRIQCKIKWKGGMLGPVVMTLILLLELYLFQRQQQWIGLILFFGIVPLVKKL